MSEASNQPDRAESTPGDPLARVLKKAAGQVKDDPALRRWLERLAVGEGEGKAP